MKFTAFALATTALFAAPLASIAGVETSGKETKNVVEETKKIAPDEDLKTDTEGKSAEPDPK